MYDSPKAAHFEAVQNGKPLPWNNEAGLRCRWAAADACRACGVSDMLRADPALVAEALVATNARLNGFAVVRLREGV